MVLGITGFDRIGDCETRFNVVLEMGLRSRWYVLFFFPPLPLSSHTSTCFETDMVLSWAGGIVYALPLLSSFLDVSGQLLLVVAFEINKRTSSSSIGGVIPDSTTTTEKVVVGGEVLDGLIRRFLG